MINTPAYWDKKLAKYRPWTIINNTKIEKQRHIAILIEWELYNQKTAKEIERKIK